jgi:hypothetical protein
VVEGIDREVTVGVNSELDDGQTVRADDNGSRHDVDDLDGGRLTVPIRTFDAEPDVTYHWKVSGAVTASDDSFEAPFELALEFESQPAVEKTAEEASRRWEYVSGAVSSLLPGTWRIFDQADEFSRYLEHATVEPAPLDVDEFSGIVVLRSGDHDSTVRIYRADRPLGLAAPDTAIDELTTELISAGFEDPRSEPLELGGYAGVRFEASSADGEFLIDFVPVEDEYFLIQTSIVSGDDAPADARTTVDSIQFHPEHFARLTHAVTCHSSFTRGGATTRVSIDAPATWAAPSDPTNGVTCEAEPGGDRVEAYTFPLGGRTVEEVLAARLADLGYAVADIEIEQATFGDQPGRIGTVPDSATVFAAIEWPAELDMVGVVAIATGDHELNLAMARSIVGEVDA